MIDLENNAEQALRMVRGSRLIAYDTETSGLDWKRNHPVGYVVTDRHNSVYVPVRHGGGGNLNDPTGQAGPLDSANQLGVKQHPFEAQLAKAFEDRRAANLRTVGHHLKFDMHMSANQGIILGRNCSCTQNNQTLINEYTRSYSLDSLGKEYGVTYKRGEEMYERLASLFGGAASKGQMEHFWRTSGVDPVGYDYAAGDGVTTLEVYAKQIEELARPDDLGLTREKIFEVENELIYTLFRMERRGIPVDMGYIGDLVDYIERKIVKSKAMLPEGFNPRSPVQMKKLMEQHGHTNWPTTELGNPSFNAKWLESHEIGRAVVGLRQWTNLLNTFVVPLRDEHAFNGSVHASLHQNRADEHGTISGRLSCGSPNLQAVPKHNKVLAAKLRAAFVAASGMKFCEADLSQCFVAGTKVSVPATKEHPDGTINIEDIKPGQLVYCYDDDLNLTLRPVTWAGKTGRRPVVRVKWMTNGRTEGELVLTKDHRIRMRDGSYRTVEDLMQDRNSRGKHLYFHRVMALSRIKQAPRGSERWYLYCPGSVKHIESRLVGQVVHGPAEHYHHVDGDTLNNCPTNLIGVAASEHMREHAKHDRDALVAAINSGKSNVEIAREFGIPRQTVYGYRNRWNHIIYDFDDVEGEHDVYDITVDEFHNFIANEVCVHNCEPRLFAHYSKDERLIAGYNATPPTDVHTIVADMLKVDRGTTGKRMNMGIFTGMQKPTFANHMGVERSVSDPMFDAWYELFPGVRDFQNQAKRNIISNGFVRTILGRRGNLESSRFAYVATSKIIQGGNADIIKYKLVEIDKELEKHEDAWLTMSIHDSILWMSGLDDRATELDKWIVSRMVDVQTPPFNLRVPFAADFDSGKNWAEASFGPKAEELSIYNERSE